MTTELYTTDQQGEGLPSPEHRHLAHPNPEAPWIPFTTLCGDRIEVGMSYREVGYADLNPDLECCDRCDFALFVERNEEMFFADEMRIGRVA